MKPSSFVASSIAKTNKCGESGFPCLKSLKIWKKLVGVPLINIKNLAIEMHQMIQLIRLCLNPILLKISNK